MKDFTEFSLSHLSFRAAPRCTSQLKTGIFFVTDTQLTENQLEVFDNVPLSKLAPILRKQKFGDQAQVFTIENEEGHLEVDVIDSAKQLYKGKYLTIK
jgi:hypothetical protein